MKFRLSWGITGSTAVDPYQTLNSLTSYRTVFNDARYIGYAPNASNLANPALKWETTAQYNAGVDVGLFQNRLGLTFDYYRKDTRDLLSFVQLPTSTGYASTISNIGKIRNSGIELGLNTTVIDNAFKWDLNFNFSKNKSEVIELAGGSDVFGVNIPQPLAVAVNLVRVGQPVGVFYGYLEDGLDEKGAIKYKDIDGVPGITSSDRTIIGDPNPDFLYNFSSRMAYKNFELNFDFQGVQGNDIFNVNLSAVGNSFYWGENQLKEFYNNHWSTTNPDPNAKYPKVSAKTLYSASDRYIEDDSFLKLRNIQLAYNLTVANFGVAWVKNLQVYVSGQNLLTFTKYSWYDPEINTRGGSNSISLGIDNNGYPNAKMYTFGVRLGL
ncbi:MAG: SusC/RagA family TonB-linked outer membrane protein [Adhaeribacter sp.]|nr:SusC/RagA family TonB-linked outer membrane protein [Adhaeribacter sp.]